MSKQQQQQRKDKWNKYKPISDKRKEMDTSQEPQGGDRRDKKPTAPLGELTWASVCSGGLSEMATVVFLMTTFHASYNPMK